MKLKCNNIHVVCILALLLVLPLSCCSATTSSAETETVSSTDTSETGTISASDSPTGIASYEAKTKFGGYGGTSVTVTTASDLKKYAAKGNYVIYVNGIIDVTEGVLPSSASDDNDNLGSFIAKYTGGTYTSWSAWRTAFAAACKTSSDYTTTDSAINEYQSKLVAAWKNRIRIPVASNTTIIGLIPESGIQGGSLIISDVSNIAIRNIVIEDAFDPFPHHEDGDGFNAQYDGITIQNTNSNIWIDHCTFKDTISVGFDTFAYPTLADGSTTEMWQTYDGSCDIKGTAQYVTVSWCKFLDHDKTMLIGSSKSDTGTKFVTLSHNYFCGCVQRMPMVRKTSIHIYNNYYTVPSGSAYKNSYAVGAREDCKIVAENNYFASGIQYSYKNSDGILYKSGDSDFSRKGCGSTTTTTKPWEPSFYYTYTTDAASDVPSLVESGAGVLTAK